MIVVTALKKVSYEIPKSGSTQNRSVSLEAGGSDTMSTLEYIAAESLLSGLQTAGALSYTPPSGDPIVDDGTLSLGDMDASVALQVQGLSMTSVPVANLPSGGSVGSAASTVDVTNVLLVDQTTGSETLTLPSPTASTHVRKLVVVNVGSASFTMLSQTVAAGTALEAIWTGSAWAYVA